MTILTEMLCKIRWFVGVVAALTIVSFASLFAMLFGIVTRKDDVLLESLPVCSISAFTALVLCVVIAACCHNDERRYEQQRLAVAPGDPVHEQDVPMLSWIRPCRIVFPSLWAAVFILYGLVCFIYFWPGKTHSIQVEAFVLPVVSIILMLIASVFCPPKIITAIETISAGHPGNQELNQLNGNNDVGGGANIVAGEAARNNDVAEARV